MAVPCLHKYVPSVCPISDSPLRVRHDKSTMASGGLGYPACSQRTREKCDDLMPNCPSGQLQKVSSVLILSSQDCHWRSRGGGRNADRGAPRPREVGARKYKSEDAASEQSSSPAFSLLSDQTPRPSCDVAMSPVSWRLRRCFERFSSRFRRPPR